MFHLQQSSTSIKFSEQSMLKVLFFLNVNIYKSYPFLSVIH